MDEQQLLLEYEEILLNKRSEFSIEVLTKGMPERDVAAVIRYAFHDLLGWSPSELYDFLTPEIMHTLHLDELLRKINYPYGLNKTEDLNYLAGIVNADGRDPEKRAVLDVYIKMLEGKLNKYPKDFFVSGYRNVATCLQYSFDYFGFSMDIDRLYQYFADEKQAMEYLKKACLNKVCKDYYNSPLDMLHDCLPLEDQSDFWYHFAKFQTVYKEKGYTVSIYQKILKGELNKYPKGFFQKREAVRTCFRYSFEFLDIHPNVIEKYRFFSDENDGYMYLSKVHLDKICRKWYQSPLEMLHDCIPSRERSDYWYHYFLFHSSFADKRDSYNDMEENHENDSPW